jgi:hypothetical protein
MRSARFVVAVVAMSMLAVGCSGGDSDDEEETGGDVAVTVEGSGGPAPETTVAGAPASGGADVASGPFTNPNGLVSIWPLPPGDFTELFPYEVVDNGEDLDEKATFSTETVTQEEIVAFYEEFFPTIGLQVELFPNGGGTAIDLIDPARPTWLGAVTVLPGPEQEGVLVLQDANALLE